MLLGERAVRVRGVHVHDEPRERASAGQRVAVNITGTSREQVRRGDVLATPGVTLRASHMLDCLLELHGSACNHERVQVHHGTRESAARLVRLGEAAAGAYWQLRTEQPLLAAAGDRVVVRRISVPDTLGGGLVLDPGARRHSPSEQLLQRLESLRRGEASPSEGPRNEKSHGGTRPGSGSPEPRAAAERPEPRGLSQEALGLERVLRDAGARTPSEAELGDAARHVPELRAAGRAVRVGRSMYAHADVVAEVAERVREIARAEGSVTLARVRDELGVSRRHAQALLEHLDAARLTLRLPDDTRVLRRGR